MGTTGTPSSSDNLAMLMEPPLLRTSSIMFSASTMGSSSSISCMVRYRFRSMLVASTMLMMPSGFSLDQEIPGDDLFRCIGRKGVDAGQIHHGDIAVAADDAVFPVHRHTGEVPHVLVAAGQAG